MKRALRYARQKGFTLVELLIVVAIIGILSTIGVPTFKRMVQKSKKSEAKVGLGALYTTLAAFFSEYAAYTNRIDKVGFEIEGDAVNRIYSIGFSTAACADVPTQPTDAIFRDPINAQFPQVFTACPAGEECYILRRRAGAATQDTCFPGDVAANGQVYLAVASGVIAPGINPIAVPNSTDLDIHTIDEGRSLRNPQDGVQ